MSKRELLPELRFPEFKNDGEWEEKRVREIAEINKASLSEKLTPENYLFYYIDLGSVSMGEISFPSQMIKFSTSPSRARRIVKHEDILFATVRPSLKGYARFLDTKENVVCSTGFAVISSKSEYCSSYIYQFLFSELLERQVFRLVVGSSYPAVNTSDVKRFKIPIPPLPEQQKIANCLSSLDDLIEVQSAKLEVLKEHKKGLMQQLFPDKII